MYVLGPEPPKKGTARNVGEDQGGTTGTATQPHKPGRKLLGTTPKASRLLYQNGADQFGNGPLEDRARRLLRLLRLRFSSAPEKFEKFEIHYLLAKLLKLLESTTKVESK